MPILGYDTAGVSNWGNATTKMGSNDDTDAIGGIIITFHVAVYAVDGSNKSAKLGVYDCNQGTGDPKNEALIEQVEIETLVVSDDNSISAPVGEILEASTKYLVGFALNGDNTKIKFDSGGSAYYRSGCTYGIELADPWQADSVSIARNNSIWVDYQHPGVLGYDIVGVGGSHGVLNQYRGINDITDGIGGEIKKFHCAVASVDAVNKNLKMCVADCAQSDGDPSNGAIIEQIEFEVDVGDDEWAIAAGGNNVLASTKYFIAYAVPDADTKVKYDATPECWYDWGWPYADVFPDPLDVAHTLGVAVLYSIWVDYEVSGAEFTRSISDIIGIADALSKSASFKRVITDSVGMTDILSRSATFIRSITDTIGITDVLLRLIIFIRTISDTVGITDVLSRSGTFMRSIVDVINISDILTGLIIKVRKIVDVIGITDIIKATAEEVRKIDSFGVCQIVKAKEELISAIKRIALSSVSSIVQSIKYKKSKINKVEEIIRPTINEVRGIKNE